MPSLPPFAKWLLKKYRATVLNDIWAELTFFCLVALMVCLVSTLRVNLGVSPQLLTVLGTVLGLVVSFRTSSAYDRYWEGRKLWSTILVSSRNLSQCIWIHVPNERKPKPPKGAPPVGETYGEDGDQPKAQNDMLLRSIIEKKSMINLIQAYSVSLKHYLRGEGGVYYQDLYPLIAFLPRYASVPPELPEDSDLLPLWQEHAGTSSPDPKGDDPASSADPKVQKQQPPSPAHVTQHARAQSDPEINFANESARGHKNRLFKPKQRKQTFDPEKALPDVESDVPLRPARDPPQDSLFDLPFLTSIRWVFQSKARNDNKIVRTIGGRRMVADVESNVPLEICLFLSSYLAFLLREDLLKPALATLFSNQLTAFYDSLASLERVRYTPIPFAYQVHLRMSTWLYLALLPFQIYNSFGWLTIPATAFASLLILGFLEIGREIENPFSYELNDLDLDGFCLAIQRELHEVTAHIAPDPADYIFSVYNQPFAPADRRNAEAMLKDADHAYMRPGDEGIGSVRKTLLRNWREVTRATKEPKWRAF